MDENAIKAGMDLLDQGGSAVDAARSVALSQITTVGGKYDIYTPGAPALGRSVVESSALFESRSDLQSPETLYRLYLIGTYSFDNAVSFDSSIIT